VKAKVVASCQEACLLDRLGCGAFTWDAATGACVITPHPYHVTTDQYYLRGGAASDMATKIPTPKSATPSVVVHHTREYWQLVMYK
jgi:hypothetical protein